MSRQFNIETQLMREGLNPYALSVEQCVALAESLSDDPPVRYRLDWWLYLIASILYKANGGKGELPTPPWFKRSDVAAQADEGADMLGVINALQQLNEQAKQLRNSSITGYTHG